MSTARKDIKPPKPLEPPNSNFYQLVKTLRPDELAALRQLCSFMESKVYPIINKYWVEDSFELIPAFKDLNLDGLGMQGYVPEEAHCSAVLLQWRWHALTLHSRLFSAPKWYMSMRNEVILSKENILRC